MLGDLTCYIASKIKIIYLIVGILSMTASSLLQSGIVRVTPQNYKDAGALIICCPKNISAVKRGESKKVQVAE